MQCGLESWDVGRQHYDNGRREVQEIQTTLHGVQLCPCLSAENINSKHFFLYLPALCNHTYTGTCIINSLYLILIHAISNNNEGVQSASPLFLVQHRLQ